MAAILSDKYICHIKQCVLRLCSKAFREHTVRFFEVSLNVPRLSSTFHQSFLFFFFKPREHVNSISPQPSLFVMSACNKKKEKSITGMRDIHKAEQHGVNKGGGCALQQHKTRLSNTDVRQISHFMHIYLIYRFANML